MKSEPTWLLKMALTLSTTMMLFRISGSATKPGNKELHPIVLVPGSGGNQLEARLNSDYRPSSFICSKYWNNLNKNGKVSSGDGWYRIWFDPTVLVGPFTKCFSERMTLHYDPVRDDYFNAPGVQTRVPHFGSVQSLLYLDPKLKHVTAYMAPLVQSLEETGYVDTKTLYGAPYDFRYGLAAGNHPHRVGSQFLEDLKRLIEHASASNSNLPTILITHSLGGLFTLHLLLRNSPTWRRQFVKHVISLSTPWSGTVQELLTFASGYTLGVPLVDPLLVREEQRSSESNLWLMPAPATFGRDIPLVVTPDFNYTAGDVLDFLGDVGCAEGVRRYVERVLPLVERIEAPRVAFTCLVGSGVGTPERLVYLGRKGFDEQPEVVFGDGDGTVNRVSLVAVVREWGGEKDQFLRVVEFPGVSHAGILKDVGAIQTVLGVVSDVNSGVVDFDLAGR